MAENEQRPNSVPSDEAKAESSNQAEVATSSQRFGNAVLAAGRKVSPLGSFSYYDATVGLRNSIILCAFSFVGFVANILVLGFIAGWWE